MIDAQDQSQTLRAAFLDGMSRAASSVCIVTTDGPAGRGGVTVSAMTSVSADGEAPTLLTCLNASASALPLVLANGCFCVNLLRAGQTEISEIFAGRRPAPGGDRFNAVTTAPLVTGAPHLTAALASFDCRLLSAERIGTHHICIGAVASVVSAPDGEPLIYGLRRYLRTAAP